MKKFIIFLFLPFFFACDDSTEDAPIENVVLKSSTKKFGKSKSEISSEFEFGGLSSLVPFLEYDVTFYEITYTTQYKGEEITASGLVTFPETSDALPIMSFQHGTMAAHVEAPTLNSSYLSISGVGSAGYIFIVPDMIGVGSSSNVLHPYYNKEYTAGSIVDMIKATVELARQEGHEFNGELFLSGYSEGGYATMVTHQAIENTPIDNVKLIASAPSSGGYDIKGVQEYFFAQETYAQPFFLPYVALSLQSTGEVTLPMSKFFNAPYAEKIPGLFDGSKTGAIINTFLTENISELISPEFLTGVDSDPEYASTVQAFAKNSAHDWVPKIKMTLYHGDADITVPY